MAVITEEVWNDLCDANRRAVSDGWAEAGVFGTGIGPEYVTGGANSILYVGKSAGPLGAAVGSVYEQLASSNASMSWMVERRNLSAFWQLIDRFDSTRRSISWTNLSKFDRAGGTRPPSQLEWGQIKGVCLRALESEWTSLRPKLMLFATSDFGLAEIEHLAAAQGGIEKPMPFEDGCTRVWSFGGGQYWVKTRHPQGWRSSNIDRLELFLKKDILSV